MHQMSVVFVGSGKDIWYFYHSMRLVILLMNYILQVSVLKDKQTLKCGALVTRNNIGFLVSYCHHFRVKSS